MYLRHCQKFKIESIWKRIMSECMYPIKNFQGRGCFVELGHFNKHFVKNTRKKDPTGQHFGVVFFLLHTLKATFWMGNSKMDTIRTQNQDTFLILKKARPFTSPEVACLLVWLNMHQHPLKINPLCNNKCLKKLFWLCQSFEYSPSSYMFDRLLKIP